LYLPAQLRHIILLFCTCASRENIYVIVYNIYDIILHVNIYPVYDAWYYIIMCSSYTSIGKKYIIKYDIKFSHVSLNGYVLEKSQQDKRKHFWRSTFFHRKCYNSIFITIYSHYTHDYRRIYKSDMSYAMQSKDMTYTCIYLYTKYIPHRANYIMSLNCYYLLWPLYNNNMVYRIII